MSAFDSNCPLFAMYLRQLSLIGSLLASLSGCAWQKLEGNLSLDVPQSVLAAASQAGSVGEPRVIEFRRQYENVRPGDLGLKNHAEGRVRLTIEAGGIVREASVGSWGEESQGKMGGTTRTTVVSICGVQEVSYEYDSRFTTSTHMFAAAPGVTVTSDGLGQGSLIWRTLVRAISGSVLGLCQPTPGSEYSFSYSRQVQHRNGPAVNTGRSFAASIKCRTATSFVPASGYVPELSGQALEMACTRAYAGEGDYVSRYVFISGLGIYLPIETSEPERGRTAFKYLRGSW